MKKSVQAGSKAKGIQSIDVGIRVLNALSASNKPMALKEVAAASSLSSSQSHRYLASFIRGRVVSQDGQSGAYALSSQALAWGLAALGQLDPVELAAQVAKRLASDYDITCLVAIWGPHGATCVRWQRGSSLVASDVGLGTTFPLFNSATGAVFLSYLPSNLTALQIASSKASKSARAGNRSEQKPNKDRLVRLVRKQGYAIADQNFVNSLGAISAPVFDSQGILALALTLVLRVEQFASSGGRFEKLLLQETFALSESLGYRANPS